LVDSITVGISTSFLLFVVAHVQLTSCT
jgi:hypothetical protein